MDARRSTTSTKTSTERQLRQIQRVTQLNTRFIIITKRVDTLAVVCGRHTHRKREKWCCCVSHLRRGSDTTIRRSITLSRASKCSRLNAIVFFELISTNKMVFLNWKRGVFFLKTGARGSRQHFVGAGRPCFAGVALSSILQRPVVVRASSGRTQRRVDP